VADEASVISANCPLSLPDTTTPNPLAEKPAAGRRERVDLEVVLLPGGRTSLVDDFGLQASWRLRESRYLELDPHAVRGAHVRYDVPPLIWQLRLREREDRGIPAGLVS